MSTAPAEQVRSYAERNKPPRFAIVNTCDAPDRRHVAEWIGGIGYCYMARSEDPHLKLFDGMLPTRPTSIEDFGFDPVLDRGDVLFARVRASVATYEDGAPRQWQDRRSGEQFTLPLVTGIKKPAPRQVSRRMPTYG